MSQTGNSFYTKSMQGIISFDDGQGSVIENGTITTDSLSTTDFIATNLTATTLTVPTIKSNAVGDTISLYDTNTGTINVGSGTVKICNSIQATTNKISAVNPTSIFNLFDNLNNTLNIAAGQTTAGVINIGQNKTNGYISMGSASATTIIKGILSCERDIQFGGSGTNQIYSYPTTSLLELRSDGTMNCIGSGTSTFGSWNGGNVGLGTQSFSNVFIGSGGTGANVRFTLIKGTLIASGSGGANTTLWGLTSLEVITTSANYTIPAIGTLNRDYTLILITGVSLQITLPAVKLDQVLHIRNRSALTQTIVIPAGVTLYPVGAGGQTGTWSFPANASLNVISDGTNNWYGF